VADVDIHIAAENALILYLGKDISPATLAKVQRAVALIEAQNDLPVIDLIPSYSSLVVVYDPARTGYRKLRGKLLTLLESDAKGRKKRAQTIVLPVYYSPESGADLTALAASKHLGIEDIIALHSEREYLVYAIGFAPGFAYLGEVDPVLATPRLTTPRLSVPKGSVAIAGSQTAVYPSRSPGGWNLIGLCPVAMFDREATPPMPVTVGDTVVFQPISKNEFLRLGGSL